MELRFTLSLPRDEASVPFVRHMCRTALEQLEVADNCTSDIEVAVSEAATNVLRHAAEHDEEYEVQIRVDENECEISIVDTGGDFEHEALSKDLVGSSAESGRGVFLMRHLVDDLHFNSDPDSGTVVRLRKSLELRDGSSTGLLARARAQSTPSSAPATADG